MSTRFRIGVVLAFLCAALPLQAAPPNVGGCQILPTNNYWNTPVDTLPVHGSSAAWIASIGGTQGTARRLHADWGNKLNDGGQPPINEIVEYGIPFTTVSNPLPSSSVSFFYASESDPGPYPIPTTAPIEGGPTSLGDRHVIAIDTSNCILYELFAASIAGSNSWNADSGARWPLNSNASRPDGFTSADAAGLAIFPGLVRWEEVAAGEIAHAIRFTAPAIWGSTGTGRKYIWPARHWSGNLNNPNLPPMGARVRLKASFNILGFDSRTQVILRAFKKYGMVLVDGGSSWFFQGVSNVNWPDIVISELNDPLRIQGGDFEVVDTLPLQIDPNSEQSVQPPGAPTNFAGTAGNGQATFSFTPPADSGGKPVIDYTVTCGALTGTATASPITLNGLSNGVTLSCTVAARNLVFSSAASATVSVTPASPATAPGAPTIGLPIVGNTQLSIVFTAPLSNGGAAITVYTATCIGGGTFTASRSTSPITITGLAPGTPYSCSVTATNAAGVSVASAPVNATPDAAAPLTLVNIQSRKNHAAAGLFDIDIVSAPLTTDPVSVEPRTIGSGHLIVFQFNNLISDAGAVAAIDAVTMVPIAGVTSAAVGNDVAVTLTNVADNKRIRITIDGVNGVVAPMSTFVGFLVGDVNNTRSVNSSDISGVKARSGQTTTAVNFRFDINATGAVNPSDISVIKARSGLILP